MAKRGERVPSFLGKTWIVAPITILNGPHVDIGRVIPWHGEFPSWGSRDQTPSLVEPRLLPLVSGDIDPHPPTDRLYFQPISDKLIIWTAFIFWTDFI